MGERRIIYLCPTLLHLMNCIVTQMTLNKDLPADIVFEDVTDFSEISKRLAQQQVFENIYHFPFLDEITRYRAMTPAQKKAVDHKPSLLFQYPKLNHTYTDLFINLDSYAPKFFYYGLLEMGMNPDIHIVGEGTASYALDFSNTATDGMDHEYYKKRAFLKKIDKLYMYEPELYTGGSTLVHPVQLPAYGGLSENVHRTVEAVFGAAVPINEKLIFFEGCFWGDNHVMDEVGILLDIADYIGKENIIIKRHPRNTVDRFTPLGFKVMGQQTVPWEVMIKDIDLSQKVLVSMASFTCFSSVEMYGRTCYSILLEKLMRGRVGFLENVGYKRFFAKAEQKFNSERIISWSPTTREELHRVLDAAGDRIGGWQA